MEKARLESQAFCDWNFSLLYAKRPLFGGALDTLFLKKMVPEFGIPSCKFIRSAMLHFEPDERIKGNDTGRVREPQRAGGGSEYGITRH